MRRQVSTSRQAELAALLSALTAGQDAEIQEALSEVYDRVQALGGQGLNSENQINRQDALDAINAVRREWRSGTT